MISDNTYEEIYEILSYMDEATVMKIPKKVLNIIQEKRNSNFKTKIDENDIFNEKNVSKEAIDFLCWIEYTYWMKESRKQKINKIKLDKIQKSEEEKREKYNPDNLFKNRKLNQQEHETQQEVALVEVKEKFYIKFIKKLKELFGIK